ncbi:hypothetical protein VITU9109_03365 [Vibrio tubiashii ATCC 19109]|uniref:Transposase n=1 Tax=Vibrio tubiashii ATCC 19109 TaxID=1051646 RepID=A0ABN0DBC7_9VIBR|nr:hypothetical protein VITU9109_03365 [Vibrio tubiashii ATCC 19109]
MEALEQVEDVFVTLKRGEAGLARLMKVILGKHKNIGIRDSVTFSRGQ